MDGTVATAVAHDYSVTHYPTVLFVQEGKPHTYSGERTAEGMLRFAQRMRSGKCTCKGKDCNLGIWIRMIL